MVRLVRPGTIEMKVEGLDGAGHQKVLVDTSS